MRKFYLLVAALALLSFGCQSGEGQQDVPQQSVELTLTTDSAVWFGVDGGTGEIGYTLENAADNKLKATSECDWITDISVGETIGYRVTENYAAEVRRGVVRVECGDKEFSVDVMQSAFKDAGKLSTLETDHEFDIDGGVFVGAYVGDLLYAGCNTCQVYMWEDLDLETGEERGDVFQIDLQLPRNGRDILGTYTEGTNEGEWVPGWAEDVGGQYMQQNSWYMTGDYSSFAPLKRGTVTVESEDNIIYTFTIDVVDDYGYAIRGKFKGAGEFIDW